MLNHVRHCIAGQVLLRAAGESKNHGEIPLLDPTEVDGKVVFRLKGNVGFAVIRRLIVRVRIDAKHAEIPRVARPYPVVGVPAEFSHRRRRRAYEPHIAVGLRGD